MNDFLIIGIILIIMIVLAFIATGIETLINKTHKKYQKEYENIRKQIGFPPMSKVKPPRTYPPAQEKDFRKNRRCDGCGAFVGRLKVCEYCGREYD